MKEKARQGYRLHLLIIVMIAAAIIGGFFSLFLQNLAVRYHWTLPLPELQAETQAETETAEETPATEGGGSTVATRILPSVVGIKATGTALSEGLPAVTESSGSGVVIDSRGYIVTNYHVIAGAEEFRVIFHDDSEASATVVGSDQRTDLALLKVEKDGLTAAAFADDSPAVGDAAYAIGSPGGLDFAGTVTKGIVSALDRQITIDNQTMTLLQIDAAVNPGNSGGGAFDANGNLIGIVNAKSTGSNIDNLGFAIPVNTAKAVINDIIQYGYVTGRISTGFEPIDLTDRATAISYRVSRTGIYVYKVTDTTSQFRSGDLLVSMDGTVISSMSDYNSVVDAHKIGDTIDVTIIRNGEQKTVTLTFGEYVPSQNG